MYGPITLEHSHHGCFQSILCDEVSWVHNANFCDWSGIIYLTPDAPITGGTGFYSFLWTLTAHCHNTIPKAHFCFHFRNVLWTLTDHFYERIPLNHFSLLALNISLPWFKTSFRTDHLITRSE